MESKARAGANLCFRLHRPNADRSVAITITPQTAEWSLVIGQYGVRWIGNHGLAARSEHYVDFCPQVRKTSPFQAFCGQEPHGGGQFLHIPRWHDYVPFQN